MATKYIALLFASSYLMHLAGADNNGFAAVPRSVIDGAGQWTMVQRQGFPSDGYLTGFTVYLQRSLASYPITIGLYHPSSPGSCTFTVIKTWQLSGNSPGVLTVTLTGADVVPYKAGDSLGLTWYNTGNIPFDYVSAQNYCEDSVVVGAVGSTLSLVANRHGSREYSLTTSFSATPPDPCKPNPCQNGGACSSGGTSTATCNCAIGFSGATCSTVVPDPCASSPCANGGECTRTANSAFSCKCPAAYTGPSCQSVVDPCQSNPCKNGGACKASGAKATCTCAIGFSGDSCSTAVPDPCASSPCANGGQCKRTSNSGFSCACAAGYTGDTCTAQTGPCASSPCQNGGTCTNVGTTDYDCNCPDDYNDGDTCSTYQDPCSSSPCKNGGTCTRLSYTDFSCACTAKFYSTFCELKKNTQPCDNTPCQNGGVCTNTSPTTYSCQCPSAWEGQACQTVHCITGTASCPGLPYARYALCGDCSKSVACKQKKQKVKTCNQSTSPYFDRKLKKCTAAKAACTGL